MYKIQQTTYNNYWIITQNGIPMGFDYFNSEQEAADALTYYLKRMAEIALGR